MRGKAWRSALYMLAILTSISIAGAATGETSGTASVTVVDITATVTATMNANPNPLMVNEVSVVSASILFDCNSSAYTGGGVYINGYLATYDTDTESYYVKFTASSPRDVSFTVTDIDNENLESFSTDSVMVRWNPQARGSAGVEPEEGVVDVVEIPEPPRLGPLESLAALLNVPVQFVQVGVLSSFGLLLAVPVYKRANRVSIRKRAEQASRKLRGRIDKARKKHLTKREENKRDEVDWEAE